MPAGRRARTYESPLRAEQMDRTREKLIEAGIDLVTDGDGEEITLRRVAARAAVSVPTAYRYFPDRDSLVEAMATWINARIGGPLIPSRMDDAPQWIRRIYAAFEANDRMMRAQLQTPAGRAMRERSRRARQPHLLEMTKRSIPEATAATQRRFASLFQLLVNVPAWMTLHDNWGMTGSEAGEVTAWAARVLIAEIQRRPDALDFEESPVPPPPSKEKERTKPRRKATKSGT